jgi:hypothetical protein
VAAEDEQGGDEVRAHGSASLFYRAGARLGHGAHAMAVAWRRRPGLPCPAQARRGRGMTGVARLSVTASGERGSGSQLGQNLLGCGLRRDGLGLRARPS